jgi:hypothetical protein
MPDGTATAHVYRPKLLTVFAEGYGFEAFRKDVTAGITVAIVALPLSMAIAVASGVTPERGLYAAIVGGFLVCPATSCVAIDFDGDQLDQPGRLSSEHSTRQTRN